MHPERGERCTAAVLPTTAADVIAVIVIATITACHLMLPSYGLNSEGALWVRGMEYIGGATGALRGGHKVHTVRAVASYFDYSAVWLDDPMEAAFEGCYFLGNPGGAVWSMWKELRHTTLTGI